MKHTAHDIDIAFRTVYGEARDQSKAGKQAVVHVILNRARKAAGRKQFGDGTIAGACKYPWQFSCWNANDPNLPKMTNRTLFQMLEEEAARECMAAVLFVLQKVTPSDPTSGADHYCTKHKYDNDPPKWTKGNTPICQIGAHVFFKA